MDVGLDQVLVRQVEPRRRDRTGDHSLRALEKVLIVWAATGAVGEHQCRLPAASCPSAPLGIVGRRGRHVAHIDDVELGNVDAELHRRRAVEHGELGFAKVFLAFLAYVVGDLRRVLAGLDPVQVRCHAAVELDEEGVDLSARARPSWHADQIVEGLRPVSGDPSHRIGGHLVSRHPGLVAGLVHHLYQACHP